jgi:hypothetical protein
MPDPQPRYARVRPSNPEAWAVCDRCGFWFQSKDLAFQYEWAGVHLYNTGALVCTVGNRCYDKPFEQLRTIILPPDPEPIMNSRVPNLAAAENGPPQTTLSSDVAQGVISLPVADPSVFSTGNTAWVQLNNGSFAQIQITGIGASTISILSPLPFSAPINGVVSLSLTPD